MEKTYQTVQAIYDYLKQGGNSRVLFVTTLLKNLPEKELRQAYEADGRGAEFDREVLVLRSVVDTVMNGLDTQRVPEEFQTETFHALEKTCQKYKQYRAEKGGAAAELAKSLYESIQADLEPAFRHELECRLKKEPITTKRGNPQKTALSLD